LDEGNNEDLRRRLDKIERNVAFIAGMTINLAAWGGAWVLYSLYMAYLPRWGININPAFVLLAALALGCVFTLRMLRWFEKHTD
jgi:hypothetical protein